MMNKEKLKDFIKKEKKVIILVVVGLIGILLIAISEFIPKTEKKTTDTVTETYANSGYEEKIEKRLCDVISSIDGAGKVSVMVTLQSGEEYQYAKNSTNEEKTETNSSQIKNDSEYVVIDGADGDECVLVKSNTPKIQGVIIVCEGGEIQSVKNNITNAVAALLGVSTNNISVLKMKTTEE